MLKLELHKIVTIRRFVVVLSCVNILVLLIACNKPNEDLNNTNLPLTEAEQLIDSIKSVEYTSLPKTYSFIEDLKSLDSEDAQLYAEYYTLKANHYKDFNLSTIKAYTNIYERLKSKNLYEFMMEIDIAAAYFYSTTSHPEDALFYSDRALTIGYENKLVQHRALIIYAINIYFQTMTLKEIHDELEAELEEWKDLEWNYYNSTLWRILAIIKLRLKDYEGAQKTTLQSIEKNKESKLNYMLAYNYLDLGVIEKLKNNNLDAYESYILKSIRIKKRYGTNDFKILYRTIGEFYYGSKDYQKAFDYYVELTKEKHTDSLQFAKDLLNAANAYYKISPEENLEKAKAYIIEAQNYITIKDSYTDQGFVNQELPIFKTYNSADEAYDFDSESQKTSEKLNKERSLRIQNYSNKSLLKLQLKTHKVKTLEQKNALRENQLKNKELVNLSFIILLIATLLLITVLFFIRKQLNKNESLNASLEINLLEIEDVNLELQSKNSENIRLLKLNERTLFSKMLKMSTYRDSIKNLEHYLSQLISHKETLKSNELYSIKKQLRAIISEDEIWTDFQIQFEKTNPGFFKKLKKVAPDLTVNELKHCSYMVSKLNTKEVANLLNVSTRTVETTRYRIKKKLNLGKENSILDFIMSI